MAGALRSSVNRHTGYTPNMLMSGREINQSGPSFSKHLKSVFVVIC